MQPARVLEGRCVIVTGAGRGIGRAVALQVAAAGAAVLVNDVDADVAEVVAGEVRAAGGRALALAGSVADWAFAQRMVDTALQAFGRLDGLVNNAALHHEAAPWDEIEARVRRLIEVNVLGPIACGTPALKHFVAQGAGAIVNVSSAAHLGVMGHASYGATKGALASLTYGWALEAAPHGVRVNAVAPLARTRMTDTLAAYRKPAGAVGVAEPEALAPLFVYLLSDASCELNGQVLRFNGQALSVMRHPQVAPAAQSRAQWDVAALQVAFAGPLASELQAVGLAAQMQTQAMAQALLEPKP
ncbi:MAG: SDR family oxidoreductase [Rubrivivax sp.]|nr:SDR family oxidoreductase [Rubrivivax sp.]